MNIFQTSLLCFSSFSTTPSPQIQISNKQECGSPCSKQKLTDYRFAFLNSLSWMFKSSPHTPMTPQTTGGESPLCILPKDFSIFWLAPFVMPGLPDFPDSSYFSSFPPTLPEQETRRALGISPRFPEAPQPGQRANNLCAHSKDI